MKIYGTIRLDDGQRWSNLKNSIRVIRLTVHMNLWTNYSIVASHIISAHIKRYGHPSRHVHEENPVKIGQRIQEIR